MTLERIEREPGASTPAPAALAVEAASKRFGDRVVLEDASLVVEGGTVAWLGGHNGAGKTTLLRIASGLITPDSGRVRLLGLDPERDRRAYQRRLGFLSAGNGGLYARLTVRDNLDLWASLALVPRRERGAVVARALAAFGIEELAASRADRLSTGQRQRVRLALAFLHGPDVVLLDEPHSSLDEEGLGVLVAAVERVAAGGGAVVWASPGPDRDALPADVRFTVDGGRVTRV